MLVPGQQQVAVVQRRVDDVGTGRRVTEVAVAAGGREPAADRFAVFAHLPLQDVQGSLAEIKRLTGFPSVRGVYIGTNVRGGAMLVQLIQRMGWPAVEQAVEDILTYTRRRLRNRVAALPDGVYRFETVKPGPVAGPDGKPMAPHISLWIVARGVNVGLQTRLYFDDEPEANATDWVLSKILDPRRRQTLIARREGGRYVLDIHLQGDKETVFFDF